MLPGRAVCRDVRGQTDILAAGYCPFRTRYHPENRVLVTMVYANYFATMGIPIVAGHDFKERDLGENSPPVMVVN